MGSAEGRWKKGYRIKGCDQVYHLQGLLIEKSDLLFVCASVFIHHAARATDEKGGRIFGGQAMGFGLCVCVCSWMMGGMDVLFFGDAMAGLSGVLLGENLY